MKKVNKAVILAAGKGTRFLPYTKACPKEMLPVVDTPSLQLILQEIVDAGINEVLLIISPDKTMIEKHIKPAIGHYKLAYVQPMNLQKLINDKYFAIEILSQKTKKSIIQNTIKEIAILSLKNAIQVAVSSFILKECKGDDQNANGRLHTGARRGALV